MTIKEFVLENLGKEITFSRYKGNFTTGMIVGYRNKDIIVSLTTDDGWYEEDFWRDDRLLVHSPLNQSFLYCNPNNIIDIGGQEEKIESSFNIDPRRLGGDGLAMVYGIEE